MASDSTNSPEASPDRQPAVDGTGGQTLLILGASGDLTARLLLPGLGGLLATGSVGELQLVGGADGRLGR